VAQRTAESNAAGVYKDHAEPPPGSVRNRRDRHKVLQAVYGDSTIERGGWIDLDRIHSEIDALLEHDPAQAERWFLNRCLASEGAAFDFERFKQRAKRKQVAKHATVVLGADGARHDDAIGVVATEVLSGYQWPLIVIERPADAGEDYEHDLDAVDGAVREAFDTWNVWRAYCDPHWIEGLIEGWQNSFGDKRVISWLTNRPRPIAWAVRNYEQAIASGDLSHSGDETLARHVRNARRRKLTVLDDRERPMHTLSKDSHRSPRKIDAAMAAVLSWEARGDCIAAGGVFVGETAVNTVPEPKVWAPDQAPPVGQWAMPTTPVGPLGSMS
jgi:hypothetical protein